MNLNNCLLNVLNIFDLVLNIPIPEILKNLEKIYLLKNYLFIYFFAAPMACGNPWARNWTHTTAVTWEAAVATLCPQPDVPQGNSYVLYFA